MRFLFRIPFLCLLAACSPQKTKSLAFNPTDAAPFPVVRDTARGPSYPWQAKRLALTPHRILYMGAYCDTVLVQHTLSSFPLPPLPDGTPQPASLAAFARCDEQEAGAPPHWEDVQFAHLRLVLDTTAQVKGQHDEMGEAGPWFDSYPVLVENQGRDTVLIGGGDLLPLSVEARDEQGQWRPIERPSVYMCGNGVPLLFLPPHQIVLTSVYIPHGPFRTALRLRLGNTYSAAFAGGIAPAQFDSSFSLGH